MLQCVECGTMATVDHPTKKEWRRAFHAPSRPYRWIDETRVHVRREPPCPFYVIRTDQSAPTCECPSKVSDDAEREYERFPAEIVSPGAALTEEEVSDLEQLAELVNKTDLCSRLFPLFIHTCQEHSGHEPTGAVKRLAAQIEQIDRMGLHCSPQVVARVLKEYIKASSIVTRK